MGALVLLVAVLLSLSHWLIEPLVRGLIPSLSSVGLPWLLLALGLWFLAGATASEPPSDRKP